LPSTTPPTSPAAAVATPVTTATFEEPFPPVERALVFRVLLPPDRDDELRLRDEELRPRDDADGERRLDALELLGLLRELDDLEFEDFEARELDDLLLEEALLFGPDPFELRVVVFRFVPERELAWAIAPP
jgi:hypothetical protein